MSALKKYLRNRQGQTLVELALVLPVFILLVAGILEFGMVLNQYLVVTEASREGARMAALGATDAEVAAVVQTAAASVDGGNVAVTILPAQRTRGGAVTVNVAHPVHFVTPLISSFFPANFNVRGSTVMRVE